MPLSVQMFSFYSLVYISLLSQNFPLHLYDLYMIYNIALLSIYADVQKMSNIS